MSTTIQALGIDKLPRPERLALVHAIWDTIVAEPLPLLLSDAQRQELTRRVAEDDAAPDDVIPWEQVEAQTSGSAVEIMSLPLVFRTVAQTEFDDAAVWYDTQQTGLGVDFVAEVQQVLSTIANQPDRYPIASGDVREAPVQRFPYCVYYRVKPNRVVVLAVFHTARDPAIWQARA